MHLCQLIAHDFAGLYGQQVVAAGHVLRLLLSDSAVLRVHRQKAAPGDDRR